MQFLWVFLSVPILAVVALTPEDIVQFGVVRQRCTSEVPVDPAVIQSVRAGEMVNDPQFDCFLACIMDGMGLAKPNGMLNADAAIEKIPAVGFRDNLVKAINTCSNESGANKCETAHRLFACMHDQGVPDMIRAAAVIM